jgi:pimeloyl-ACP methyl ester carboxylesterase
MHGHGGWPGREPGLHGRGAAAFCLFLLCACTAVGPSSQQNRQNRTVATMNTTAVTNTSDSRLAMQTAAAGSGPVIALVGGGLTGWLSWEAHQKRLAATRTAVRVQPLSVQFGLENRALPDGYSVRLESRALARGLEAGGFGEAIDVVAWSYGGAIALDYALEHPERIRTLTLIEPPAFWVARATGLVDPSGEREIERMHASYTDMKNDVSEDALAAFVEQVALCPPGQSPRALPAWPVWARHRQSLRTGDAAFDHNDEVARLRAFSRPVLLVQGTGSWPVLHRVVDGLAATLPRAERIELPGGHAPQIVAMDAFLARLTAFTGSL